jgi:branched-chain amino acid transport system permease protein
MSKPAPDGSTDVTAARRGGQLMPVVIGPLLVGAIGVLAYVLFPADLALLAQMAAIALFVLSLDLVVGYCGIATLGHAALFGVGAYTAALVSIHFVRDPFVMVLAGGLAGALAGLLSGGVILRAAGLPQLVVSIAVMALVREAANKMSWLTGGSDGLSGIRPSPILGYFPISFLSPAAYFLGLALLVVVLIVLARIVRSPFGLLCRGIKEDPLRIAALGGRVFPTLLKMYVLSGAVAGIAGAVSAIGTRVVSLDSLDFQLSASSLVILILGGSGTLYGGLVGTVVFMVLEHNLQKAYPFHWLAAIGATLVAVVLFLPRGLQQLTGVVGLLRRARDDRGGGGREGGAAL